MIAAFERRLLASPTGLDGTPPNESYPTDVASVAAAIAVHGRINGADHSQGDRPLGPSASAARKSTPRAALQSSAWAPGTASPRRPPRLGHRPRRVLRGLRQSPHGRAAHRRPAPRASSLGFGGIREYAPGRGKGNVDSGPVLLGISVSATGFALAPLRALGHRDDFTRIYRTTALFGVPFEGGASARFLTGGAIGNALLLALLTSGPELAP